MKLLVCGGAGFIGSTFARQRVREHGDEVTVLDKLTYAGREENFHDLVDDPRFRFVRGAIEDREAVARRDRGGCARGDRQLRRRDARRPLDRGARRVRLHARAGHLRAAGGRAHPAGHPPRRTGRRARPALRAGLDRRGVRLDREGTFTEESPLAPSSPYSATKAGADLLVQSYFHTYGLPALICRGSNNYGPYQYPEKLIPLMVLNAMHGDALPVYGDGMQVRNWIHSTDFAAAIGHVLEHGQPGEVYNAGGPDEEANMTVVTRIVELTGASPSQIEHVTDRPGHDRRYSLSSEKVRALGWSPRVRFDEGLEQTVAWYRENAWWWEPIRSGEYRAYYERQYGRSLS